MKVLLTFVVLGVLAGAGAGGWWAYEEGYWGGNPRAPTLVNFRPVIEAWAQRKDELRPQCTTAFSDGGDGVLRGHPGIGLHDTPGLGAVALALRTARPYQQEARDRAILRLDVLAKAGLFKVTDTEIEGDTGEMAPAREYVLTVKGWEHSEGSCFFLGRPEVLEVTSFARVQPDPDGVRAYDVSYKVGVRELPAWLREGDGRDLFADVAKTVDPKEKRLRLLRSERGWLPEPLVKTKEGLDRVRLARTMDELLPALDTARIMRLAAAGDLAEPKACLLLPRRAGVEADELASGLTGPMSATYYEEESLLGEPNRIRRVWLSRLTKLAAAGLFRTEDLPRDQTRNRPPGKKFILADAYLPHIDKKNPGCLKLGTVKMQVLANGIQVQPRLDGELNYRFKAIGAIAADAWSRSVNLAAVPEAKAYLEYGVPITGYVAFRNGEWKIVSGGSVTPVVVQFRESRAAAVAASALAPGTAPGRPAARVHVLSVYKGKTFAPSRPGETQTGRIQVRVGLRGAPVTLVLSAYDPVIWSISSESGVNIARVVVLGYHKGSVEGVAYDKLAYPGGSRLPHAGGSRRRMGPGLEAIPELVERLVGRRPDSVQSAYEADHFNLGSAPSAVSGDCNITKSMEGGRASYSGNCPGSSASGSAAAAAVRRPQSVPPAYPGAHVPMAPPSPSTVIVPLPRGGVEIRSGTESRR